MSDGGVWIGIAGIEILLAYYALAASWLARRRHVPAPPKPDAMLSPAEIRFLYKRAFDGRTLLVAILDLVARGALSIKHRPNGTSYLERSLDTVDDSALPDDAAIVRASLFRAGNLMVDLTDAREDALPNTGRTLRSWLGRRYISGPGLTRVGWIWLLLAGGVLATSSIILTGNASGYGAAKTAALVAFYIFGLVSVASCILFAQQFREVVFAMKAVIVFTIIPGMPVLLVLVAGTLIDFHEAHGVVGLAPFFLPLIGSGLLLWIGRSRFEIAPATIGQMDEWYRRVEAGPAPRDASQEGNGGAPIDPLAIVAVAFDAGDAAFGRLGSVFDDLTIPSDRLSLFGKSHAPAADLASIGTIGTR